MFKYKSEKVKSVVITQTEDITVVDVFDDEGLKTICFHGGPFNFRKDEEREKTKKDICNV